MMIAELTSYKVSASDVSQETFVFLEFSSIRENWVVYMLTF